MQYLRKVMGKTKRDGVSNSEARKQFPSIAAKDNVKKKLSQMVWLSNDNEQEPVRKNIRNTEDTDSKKA